MAYVGTTEATGEAKPITRIHYAVEYTDPTGRRRRSRRPTLGSAERFTKHLRLGSDAVIRMVVRQAKR